MDVRVGTLLWSDNNTWVNRVGGKPVAGDNVTIPYGWNLVIDVSPPPLYSLFIMGNVTFSTSANITLQANFVISYLSGYFWIGQRNAPHPANVTAAIILNGTRQVSR